MIVSTFDINVEIPPTVRIGDQCHRSHNVILSQSGMVHDTVTYSSIELSRGDSILLHFNQKGLNMYGKRQNRDWRCSTMALFTMMNLWLKRHLRIYLHHEAMTREEIRTPLPRVEHWRRGTCVLVPFYDLTMTNATNGRAFHPVQLQFDCGLLDGSTCTQHESVS